MQSLPPTMVAALAPFATLFVCGKTWSKAVLLITGAILCHRGRTVCSALRVMGLKGEKAFTTYHRILNKVSWDTLKASKHLIDQIDDGEGPLVLGIDEHLERRRGKKIKAKGCYRDAVRSSRKCTVKSLGLKWISVMVLKRPTWTKRALALPFLTVLAPSKAASAKEGKKHKTTIDWTLQIMMRIRRWLPDRDLILAADGGFANAKLAWASYKYKFALITRLRRDARLCELPPEKTGKKGRPRKKGARLKSPKDILETQDLPWKKIAVRWYRKAIKQVECLTLSCVWDVAGSEPIPIRLILVRDPEGKYESISIMSTGLTLSVEAIIQAYVDRWGVEVTFREVREHLGVETQRQWSDKAIARTTPALFAIYSLVVLMGEALMRTKRVDPEETGWYHKETLTFSDLLRAVRGEIWRARNISKEAPQADMVKNAPTELENTLMDYLAEAA